MRITSMETCQVFLHHDCVSSESHNRSYCVSSEVQVMHIIYEKVIFMASHILLVIFSATVYQKVTMLLYSRVLFDIQVLRI